MSRGCILITAGVLGFTGIALGAFGAHALHAALAARGTVAIWQTAVSYHLVHSVALLALAGWRTDLADRAARLAGAAAWSWTAGVVFFSGSLYALALGAPAVTGLITPVGGVLFLAGWSLVVALGWRRPPAAPPG